MADDTDRLPKLSDDFDEHAETIVLEESDVMATEEVEQLLDPEPGDDLPADGES